MSGNQEPRTAPAAALRDYPDALPPLLVKELRQGLRGRLFVIPFCILHGVLALGSLDRSLPAAQLFWLGLGAMLILLLPSRNLSALGEERDANTLDTLLLTGLTPWRIVWGKWASAAALILLTALSAVPYVVMRWVHGGQPLRTEGAMLVVAVVLGLSLTAVLTALSVLRSPLLRNAAAVFIAGVAYIKTFAPYAGGGGARSGTALLVFALWAGVFALVSAAQSLPSTGNDRLKAVRRAVSLGAVLLLGFSADPGASVTAWLVFLASCAAEMTGAGTSCGPGAEKWRPHQLLWRGGWVGGVIFCLVLGAVALMLPVSSALPEAASVVALGFFPVTIRLAVTVAWRGKVPVFLACMAFSYCAGSLLTALLPAARDWIALLFPAPGLSGAFPWKGAAVWAGSALLIGLWHLRLHPRFRGTT